MASRRTRSSYLALALDEDIDIRWERWLPALLVLLISQSLAVARCHAVLRRDLDVPGTSPALVHRALGVRSAALVIHSHLSFLLIHHRLVSLLLLIGGSIEIHNVQADGDVLVIVLAREQDFLLAGLVVDAPVRVLLLERLNVAVRVGGRAVLFRLELDLLVEFGGELLRGVITEAEGGAERSGDL